MAFQSSLLRLLDERGYIHQATDAAALDALAAREIVTGYIGFDATAPSLHVGSLVQIMMLRRMQLTAWVASHAETPTAQSMGEPYTQGSVELAEAFLSESG